MRELYSISSYCVCKRLWYFEVHVCENKDIINILYLYVCCQCACLMKTNKSSMFTVTLVNYEFVKIDILFSHISFHCKKSSKIKHGNNTVAHVHITAAYFPSRIFGKYRIPYTQSFAKRHTKLCV